MAKKADQDGKAFKTNLSHPSYAVVTFTSVRSAIVARQCLADGGAPNSWTKVDDIPIYPLADSPPLICFPRGCMKPISPTVSYTSKKIRRTIVHFILVAFTVLWVIPVSLVNTFILSPNQLPAITGWDEATLTRLVTPLSGLTQMLLFSVCPTLFKFLAGVEGSSSNLEKAEQRAMIFFWYFFIIARYMGPILFNSVISFVRGGKHY